MIKQCMLFLLISYAPLVWSGGMVAALGSMPTTPTKSSSYAGGGTAQTPAKDEHDLKQLLFTYARTDFESLATLIEIWSGPNITKYVNAQDRDGNTILHLVLKTYATGSLTQSLSESHALNAVGVIVSVRGLRKDAKGEGKTVMDLVLGNSRLKIFENLLDGFPTSDDLHQKELQNARRELELLRKQREEAQQRAARAKALSKALEEENERQSVEAQEKEERLRKKVPSVSLNERRPTRLSVGKASFVIGSLLALFAGRKYYVHKKEKESLQKSNPVERMQ